MSLECLETAPEDVGLGGAESVGKTVKPLTVRWLKVHLDRLGNP